VITLPTSQAALLVFLSAATRTRIISAYFMTHRVFVFSASVGFFDSFALLLFFQRVNPYGYSSIYLPGVACFLFI